MKLIRLEDFILLPNRQRRTFDEKKLQELAGSIQEKGILHPPVVRNDGVTLVAGERRSKAMVWLHYMKIPFKCNGEIVPENMLPVTLIGELTDLQVREAELEENLIRVDLSWQEEAMAIAELTEMRKEQNPNWTAKDTARELTPEDEKEHSATYQKVREAEILKNHLNDPEVSKAKTAAEASKIIRKKIQRQTNEMLATVHAASDTQHTIINGDMLDVLPNLEANTFAVILTDPPYGINADNFGGQADAEHEYDDTPERAEQLVRVLAREGYRVCRSEAHAYVFCDIRLFFSFKEAFVAEGWDVWPTPLIWVKGNGMLPRPDHGPRRVYEAIMYAIKGNKKVNAVYPDVAVCSGVQRPTFGAEKPAELYANLLRRSVVPGDKVLDCFAGAGPIIPASNECSVTATAIELNKDKYNYILLRLNERQNIEEEKVA